MCICKLLLPRKLSVPAQNRREPNGRKRGADKEKLMAVMQKGRETTPRLIVLYAWSKAHRRHNPPFLLQKTPKATSSKTLQKGDTQMKRGRGPNHKENKTPAVQCKRTSPSIPTIHRVAVVMFYHLLHEADVVILGKVPVFLKIRSVVRRHSLD